MKKLVVTKMGGPTPEMSAKRNHRTVVYFVFVEDIHLCLKYNVKMK
jgi:hypothetical protein